MKILTKSFFIRFIAFFLILWLGYTLLSFNPVEEAVISLTIPAEKGISVEKVGDGNILLVKFNEDYRFKDYLEHGASSLEGQVQFLEQKGIPFIDNILELAEEVPACSAYFAKNDSGDYITGRNLDWFPEHTTILMYTKPDDGYASISLTDGSYFGYNYNGTPIEDVKKYMTGAAYFPFDGINEWGVVIERNSVEAEASFDPTKKTIGECSMIRLVLDYAKNTDEAVELMKKYNIFFEQVDKQQTHFLISDASGKSAVVEYIDGEMVVDYNNYPWKVSTNFQLSIFNDDAYAVAACPSYRGVFNYLQKNDGVLPGNMPIILLRKIAQDNTQWSSLYNNSTGEIKIALKGDYNKLYNFKLEMKK